MKVESERLILYPLNNEEMKAMIEKENKEYVESVWGIRIERAESEGYFWLKR